MNPSKAFTTGSILIGVLAVSTASIFIRFAQIEAPALAIAAFRMTLAALFLMPVVFMRYRLEIGKLGWGILWKVILSGFFLAIHFASWITSLQYTSVASSVVLVTTTPLWVAILSTIFLKEKLSRFVVIGLAVALTGSILVGLSSEIPLLLTDKINLAGIFANNERSMFGNLLALVGALTAAGYMLIGRIIRPQLSLPVYTFMVYGVSAIFILIAVAATGTPLSGYSSPIYL